MDVTPISKCETSIFVPFTRPRIVDDFLAMFEKIDIDWATTEIIFYNDTDSEELRDKLAGFAKSHEFCRLSLPMSHQPSLDELGDQNHANRRRERVIAMRHKAQEFIGDTKYLFCLEDDTFVPPQAFKRLRALLDADPQVGLASGVEAGRWAYKHIGAWHMEPVDEPQRVSSLPYQEEGITEAEGTGMYCYVTYTDLYKEATFRNEAEPLGPDVLYGLDLRRKGHKVLVDWSVACEHRSVNGSLMPKDATEVVAYCKRDGAWVLESLGGIEIKY